VRGTGAPRDVDLRSLIARLTTIRQIHASTDRSSFARGRARSADANASWTTSRAVSASPAMACATRRKRGEARAVNRLELSAAIGLACLATSVNETRATARFFGRVRPAGCRRRQSACRIQTFGSQ
jgi:hypothetical protein